MNDKEMQHVLDRLNRLETQHLRIRTASVLVLSLAAVVTLGGLARPGEPGQPAGGNATIEAAEFVLKDSSGTACAWLKMDEHDKPVLVLRKDGAHAKLGLGIEKHSAGLAIGGPDGVSFVGVTPRGPNINFRGHNLRNGLWLGVDSDLAAGLHLYGHSLKVGAKLRVESDGSPSLRLADGDDKELFKAP